MSKRDCDSDTTSWSEKRTKIDGNDFHSFAVRKRPNKSLAPDVYTVGWICAIATEYVAAQEFLDEEHGRPQYRAPHDYNDYTLGTVGNHNVVIAVLPDGEYGTASAAVVAANMLHSFPSVRIGLLVGIAGGAPTAKHDIRLGDVVVSVPRHGDSGVFQYDFGKTIQHQAFQHTRFLNQPPTILRSALTGIQAQYTRNGHQLEETITSVLESNPRLRQEYRRPQPNTDRLFRSAISHDLACCAVSCASDASNLVPRCERAKRKDNPAIHYGQIASANTLMKDALIRDKLATEKNVLCFEMEAAGLMNHFPCLVIRGICDYSDSHKNKEWQGYAAMAAAAFTKDLLSRIPPSEVEAEEKILRVGNQSLNKELRQEILDSLRFDQIDARQMTIKNAHAKTCRWLLASPQYIDWLNPNKLDEHHGFLWIKGKPGAGKSTLMKFAYVNARENKGKIVISFFFNARGGAMEKSTIGMYQSLLLQLLERLPELQSVFDTLGLVMQSARTRKWSVEPLQELFKQAIMRLGKSQVLCFIDALDECDENQIRDMVSVFEQMGELAILADISFLVCFSSRYYPHITIAKGLDLVFEEQEGHNQDMICYLDGKLKIGRSKLAEQIRTDIQAKASGVFLWVVLVVEILNKEHDRGRIHALKRKLQQIPSDLHELFCSILTRDNDNQHELLLCIQWVLFARQPLKPEQLYFAILSGGEQEDEDILKWNPDEITVSDITRYIVDSSKGLTEITKSKSPTVQFIHESVRDFLLKGDGLKEIWPELNFQGESHERLKQCCLNYINIGIEAHLNIGTSLPRASSQEAKDLRQLADTAFPFLEYAVHNILPHADTAEGSGVKQVGFLNAFPLVNWIKLDNLFERAQIRRHTSQASLLYILAEHNLVNLIKVHLRQSNLSGFEIENERYGPPIFAALATKSSEVVRTFVKARSETEPFLPSHYSAWEEYQKRNIQPEFRRDFTFSKRRSVLSQLAENGDEGLLAFLISSEEADVNEKDGIGRTPLSWAAGNGHEAVVRLLLETGRANIESQDETGWTPLLWATRNGHETIVKLLLENGANHKTMDKDGRTPLELAAGSGHEATAKLL